MVFLSDHFERYCYHFCNILRTWLCIVLVEVCNRQRSWYCVPIASLAYNSTRNTGSCICWCILCRVARNLLKVIVPYFSDYKSHICISRTTHFPRVLKKKNLSESCAGVWNAPINLVDMMKLHYAHLHTHHKISYLPISGNYISVNKIREAKRVASALPTRWALGANICRHSHSTGNARFDFFRNVAVHDFLYSRKKKKKDKRWHLSLRAHA